MFAVSINPTWISCSSLLSQHFSTVFIFIWSWHTGSDSCPYTSYYSIHPVTCTTATFVNSFHSPHKYLCKWIIVLQVLAQEIGGFGLKRRLDRGDRSVESYDYIQARQLLHCQDPRYFEDDDNHGEEEDDEEDAETKTKR